MIEMETIESNQLIEPEQCLNCSQIVDLNNTDQLNQNNLQPIAIDPLSNGDDTSLESKTSGKQTHQTKQFLQTCITAILLLLLQILISFLLFYFSLTMDNYSLLAAPISIAILIVLQIILSFETSSLLVTHPTPSLRFFRLKGYVFIAILSITLITTDISISKPETKGNEENINRNNCMTLSQLSLTEDQKEEVKWFCNWSEDKYFTIASDIANKTADNGFSSLFQTKNDIQTAFGLYDKAFSILPLAADALMIPSSSPLFDKGDGGCALALQQWGCAAVTPVCNPLTCQHQDRCYDKYDELLQCMIDAVGEKEGRDHLFKLGDFEGHVGALGGGFLTKVQTNFLNHYAKYTAAMLTSCKNAQGTCNTTAPSDTEDDVLQPCNASWTPKKREAGVRNNTIGLVATLLLCIGLEIICCVCYSNVSTVHPSGNMSFKASWLRCLCLIVGSINSMLLFYGGALNTKNKEHDQFAAICFFVACILSTRGTISCVIFDSSSEDTVEGFQKKHKNVDGCGCETIMYHFKSPTSPFYIPKQVMLEIVENCVQLIGISNALGNTEALGVALNLFVLGANMFVTPLLFCLATVWLTNGTGTKKRQRLFLILALITEITCDKLFVIIGLLIRGRSTKKLSFIEQGFQNVPILLPALLTILDLFDAIEIHRDAFIEQKNIQREERGQKILHSRKNYLRSTNHVSNVTRRHSIFDLYLEKKKKKGHMSTKCIGVSIAGILWSMLGFSISIYSIVSYVAVQSKCKILFGDALSCVEPHYWYRNGLFDTSCALENVTHLKCHNYDITFIPDNQETYQQMSSLESIDVSNNEKFTTIPKAWSIVNISSLNVSNTAALNLPYEIASLNTLRRFDMNNTPASLVIDWHGLNITTLIITKIVQEQISQTVNVLNLSYNNFSNQLILRTDIELVSCDCLDPLVFLGNHLVLDLSHNQFKTVTTGYALDKFLFRGPTAVLFNGNPIEHINIISTPAIHTKTLGLLVNEIAKSSTSDITFLRFKAITNIYLGDVDREKNGIMPFDLKYMPKLIQLDLSVLQMTRLPANLHVLTELEYFHMNFNKVRTLKRSDISSLLKLDRFQIAKNDLEDVEDDVFDDLHHLKSIQLDGNVKLQKVPSSVAKSTVTWLGLDELPLLGDEGMLTDQEFNQMTNLDRLEICNTGITKYPRIINSKLSSFQCCRNPYLKDTFPTSYKTTLTQLKLSENNLLIFPPALKEYKYLRKLELVKNKILSIPSWVTTSTFPLMNQLQIHYNKKVLEPGINNNPLIPETCNFYDMDEKERPLGTNCTKFKCMSTDLDVVKVCSGNGGDVSDCSDKCNIQKLMQKDIYC